MASRLAALALVLMLIQNSGFVLVMRYSRRQQQGMDAAQYNVAVVVVLQELFKLVFCFVATTAQESAGAAVRTLGQYQEAARVLVPAACFTLQNNILYVALSNLDPLVFQITYQIKTLLTALLSVHLLKRSFSRWQWVSQLLLTAGVVLTQLNESPDRKVDEAARQKQSLLLGLLAVLTAAASSSYGAPRGWPPQTPAAESTRRGGHEHTPPGPAPRRSVCLLRAPAEGARAAPEPRARRRRAQGGERHGRPAHGRRRCVAVGAQHAPLHVDRADEPPPRRGAGPLLAVLVCALLHCPHRRPPAARPLPTRGARRCTASRRAPG